MIYSEMRRRIEIAREISLATSFWKKEEKLDQEYEKEYEKKWRERKRRREEKGRRSGLSFPFRLSFSLFYCA